MLLIWIISFILATTGFGPAIAFDHWLAVHWFITILLFFFFA